MKRCSGVMMVALLFVVGGVRGQTIVQLTQQLALDYEKLSELKSVLSDMQKAYTIISSGYDNIKGLSEGNFNLHKVFLDGLLAVSPAVKNYEKVAEIISVQEQIGKEYKAAYSLFNSSGIFSASEMGYISRVYNNLFVESLKNIDELTMILTASQLRMSDDERLTSIDRIDQDILDKLSFLRNFNNNTSVQMQQRLREQNDIGTVKALLGLDN